MKKILYILLFVPLALFGQDNYSLSFDGVDDYVEIQNNSGFDLSESFTIILFTKINDDDIEPCEQMTFIGENNSPSNNEVFFFGYNGCHSACQNGYCVGLDFYETLPNVALYTSSYVSDDWISWVATYNSETARRKIYADGVLIGDSIMSNIYQGNSNLILGAQYDYFDVLFKGKMDNLIILDDDMEFNEIQSHVMCTSYIDDDGIIGYWNFNEGSGDTLYDISGNGNHGVIHGATYSEDVPEESCNVVSEDGPFSHPSLNDSLVAWYPFNGNANDESLNDNHGEVVGAILAVDRFGNENNAFSFEGQNCCGTPDQNIQEINIYQNILKLNEDYAVSCWMKSENIEKYQQCLFNSISHTGFAVEYNNEHVPDKIIYGVGSSNAFWDLIYASGTKSDFIQNEWYNVVFVKSSLEYSVYVNGILEGSSIVNESSNYTDSVGLRIGSIGGGHEIFNGVLDDIAIWNRELTSKEVEQLYSGFISGCMDSLASNFNPMATIDSALCEYSITKIEVPSTYPTIQEAINASNNGDTVYVSSGVYQENIDFKGKNIVLKGVSSDSTIIAGVGDENPVVTIGSGEDTTSVLSGFTISGGLNGGIRITDASPRLIDLVIANNQDTDGGGIYISNSQNTVITNSIIKDNSSESHGGGIAVFDSSDIEIRNCKISNNSSITGGGIYSANSELEISHTVIYENESTNDGGGITISSYSSNGSSLSLSNATLYSNSSINTPQAGGIILAGSNSSASISNSIIWDRVQGSNFELSYTNIQLELNGGLEIASGQGNIDSVALFVDAEEGDFSLQKGSPCIDAGNPEDELDPDGTRADIGAFYFHQTFGCTDSLMYNFNDEANTDDGSCELYSYGCIDSTAYNFDEVANTDDGSCMTYEEFTIDSLQQALSVFETIEEEQDYSLFIDQYDWIQLNMIELNESYTIQIDVKFPLPSNEDGHNTFFADLNSGGAADLVHLFFHEICGLGIDNQYGSGNCGVSGAYGIGFHLDQVSEGWHKLTKVSKLDTSFFYLDKNYVGKIAQTIGGQISSIGNNAGSNGVAPQNSGYIDNPVIWSYDLTQEEVESNMTCKLTGDEEGLVAYWNFNEASGDTVYDLSGNGNHGIIHGATYSEDVHDSQKGCTDVKALNYDETALCDNGSCVYAGDQYTLLEEENLVLSDSLSTSQQNLTLLEGDASTSLSSMQLALDSWNTTIDLTAGWNMFGYGCPEPIDLVQAMSEHTDNIIILKDNNGKAYMPEFGFNGIGDLTPGQGYQIKVTDSIEGFSLCDWYVNDIPEDNIVSLQEENASMKAELDSLYGCMDEGSCNFDSTAVLNDSSCDYETCLDECGVINGDNTTCLDCAGVPNGTAEDLGCGCDQPAAQEGYDCDGNISAQIGDEFEGGYLFYLDESGSRGLVAAKEDLDGEYQWGCYGNDVDGAYMQEIGFGLHNTKQIVSSDCFESQTAVAEALLYESEGYSDWYLPSRFELMEMYDNISQNSTIGNIGGFTNDDYGEYYWSSSQESDSTSYSLSFSTSDKGPNSKFLSYYVRPIRAFGYTLGCMDSTACNFNPKANMSDGSCEYAEERYDCEGNEITYQVGDYAQGGIVFYVDETGKHGLVAASGDLPGTYEWGCYNQDVNGADGQAIGTGYQNTMDIVNQGCTTGNGGVTAAQAALHVEINGHTDWYLPSIDELKLVFHNIAHGAVTNITNLNDGSYMSSTELSATMADGMNFWTNNAPSSFVAEDAGNIGPQFKNALYLICPIRSF